MCPPLASHHVGRQREEIPFCTKDSWDPCLQHVIFHKAEPKSKLGRGGLGDRETRKPAACRWLVRLSQGCLSAGDNRVALALNRVRWPPAHLYGSGYRLGPARRLNNRWHCLRLTAMRR